MNRDRTAARGHVYLVGVGPGDPELITVKALKVLAEADVVLHDDTLTPEMVALIPATAHAERVGNRAEIIRRLCEYAAKGRRVVRLKGGDGSIFGRACEEIRALRAAHVPFSIVPGVTAASGAAAAAGVSLTDRRLGSALVLLTARRCTGNPPPDWKAIAALGGGVAIYMPSGHEPQLARDLIEGGLDPETPCIAVSRASRTDERIVEIPLRKLPELAALPAPVILLIGISR
jgi:uroporphyrin-III C-methyltransferase